MKKHNEQKQAARMWICNEADRSIRMCAGEGGLHDEAKRSEGRRKEGKKGRREEERNQMKERNERVVMNQRKNGDHAS